MAGRNTRLLDKACSHLTRKTSAEQDEAYTGYTGVIHSSQPVLRTRHLVLSHPEIQRKQLPEK